MDKIICVGKNYPAHAAELGEAQPETPVLFLKPLSSLCALSIDEERRVPLPKGDVHHELEVVLKLNPAGSPHPFSAFTLGLDLTRRDLQSNLKKAGQPWEIAKVFSHSAIVNLWQPYHLWSEYSHLPFRLEINGEVRQSATPREMLWPPEACLKLAASYFPLCAGDLLFTGTPKGVGPLKSGDRVAFSWGSAAWAGFAVQ